MSRLKNKINDKTRPVQVVMTENTVVYKIPTGEEKEMLGHFVESEIVDGYIVFRFATKKVTTPVFRIEHLNEPFVIDFK